MGRPMRRLWRDVLDRVDPYDAGKSLEVLARDQPEKGREIAAELGMSERWVRTQWAHARAWLRRQMALGTS